MGETGHDQHKLEKLWQQDETAILEMRDKGVAGYIESLDGVEAAFNVDNEMCGCIDEGFDGDLNLAGSGILLGDDEFRAVLWRMKDAGLKIITTHDGCGAAALYAKKKKITVDKAMAQNEKRLRELTDELDLKYSHVTSSEMSRPANLHTARVIYVDGTGHFNPENVKGLPKGFGISRTYTELQYALAEIEVSVEIALGGHGFGDRFTADKPLIIIPVGGNVESGGIPLEELQYELEEGLSKVLEQNGKRVVIDGFSAPAQSE